MIAGVLCILLNIYGDPLRRLSRGLKKVSTPIRKISALWLRATWPIHPVKRRFLEVVSAPLRRDCRLLLYPVHGTILRRGGNHLSDSTKVEYFRRRRHHVRLRGLTRVCGRIKEEHRVWCCRRHLLEEPESPDDSNARHGTTIVQDGDESPRGPRAPRVSDDGH